MKNKRSYEYDEVLKQLQDDNDKPAEILVQCEACKKTGSFEDFVTYYDDCLTHPGQSADYYGCPDCGGFVTHEIIIECPLCKLDTRKIVALGVHPTRNILKEQFQEIDEYQDKCNEELIKKRKKERK